jgi:hypothetical protein
MNTMDKDDLRQIEKVVGALITHKIDEVSNKFDEKLIVFKEEIKEEFRHQLGIQSENFQHKLDIVVEGHQMLSEKLDRVEARIDKRMDGLERKICEVDVNLSKKIETVEDKTDANTAAVGTLSEKIDAVATDLKAHRADTEVHKKVYKVKEE